MSKVLIIYGSTTWNNEALAEWIEEILTEEWHKVTIWSWSDHSPSEIKGYDFTFLGSSTWGDWDLQDEMADFVEALKEEELDWAKVAVFWNWMSSFPKFCNGADQIEEAAQDSWADLVWEVIKVDWDVYDEMDAVKDWAKEIVS